MLSQHKIFDRLYLQALGKCMMIGREIGRIDWSSGNFGNKSRNFGNKSRQTEFEISAAILRNKYDLGMDCISLEPKWVLSFGERMQLRTEESPWLKHQVAEKGARYAMG